MNSNSTPISVTSDDVDHFRRSLSQLQTPSALQRVVDWMGINEKDSLKCRDNIVANIDDSETFLRCDYKVNETDTQVKEDVNLTSVFNKSVPLCESPFSIDSKSSHTQDIEEQHISKSEYKNNHITNYLVTPSNEIKKKELCSYLKLMTHGVKKEICPSRFRRSTRVQNQEKKKQIVKCPNNDDEVYSVKSGRTNRSRFRHQVESFALQSFEDLNMIVDTSKYPLLQEDIGKKVFNFVMPPHDVLKEFNDFQFWVDPYVKDSNGFKTLNDKNLNPLNCIEERLRIKVSESKRIDEMNKELIRSRKRMKQKSNSIVEYSEVNENDDVIEVVSKNIVENDFIKDSQLKNATERKIIILLHDATVVNGFDNDIDSEQPKIIPEEMEETENSAKIKIRIDYNDKQYDDESRGNLLSDDDSQMPFKGFPPKIIEESEWNVTKFNSLRSCIQRVPEKKNINIPTIENKNNIHTNQMKPNCINFHTEEEEIQSNHSSSSDSHSTIHTENSSTSNSSSISGIKSLNPQSIQNFERISPSKITPRSVEVTPFVEKMDVESLHNLLKRQIKAVPSSIMLNSVNDWDSDNSINDKQKYSTSKNNHFISFKKENGVIQNAVYVDFYLIVVQELTVSMWNQTALGNVLGAQNLWIFNGDTKKLILNKECIRKKSLEMTVSNENCVAYVELWTKEHKSDIRQGPVADIFAIVYFWIQKLNRMDKKVHQLENINGFSDDVQYVVLKSSLNIVVSWHSVIEDVKTTQIHVYTLAKDFQKVVNVRAMSKVGHYVSSLHNIEDCEDLLMGCGEHTITLWNIEHGYVVASIELNDIKLSLSTLWTKCDRGILFTVQQCVDKELRLIAINGRSHSWKKLKSYKPPEGFERIQNVYIENGVLISFYKEGILCWKAQTAEQILEENHETDIKYFPSGKYVIMTTEKSVFIRHALTHLLTSD